MDKVFFVVDIDRCWGCKSCQTACKLEHNLPAEAAWLIEVFRLETNGSEQVYCDFVPTMCLHCDEPACLPACPLGAISKRDDGLVLVDENTCIGCALCEEACPYGAIQVGQLAAGKKAVKCDLCVQRRARGFLCSCEQHCLGEVFTSCGTVKKDELVSKKRYHWSVGQVVYVSDSLQNLGKEVNG